MSYPPPLREYVGNTWVTPQAIDRRLSIANTQYDGCGITRRTSSEVHTRSDPERTEDPQGSRASQPTSHQRSPTVLPYNATDIVRLAKMEHELELERFAKR